VSTLSLAVAPMFPWPVLAGLAFAAALIVAFGLFRRARGMGWRVLAIAALLLALLNPVVIEEERKTLPDVAAVIVDDSASQRIGGRAAETEAALAHIRAKLAAMSDLEVKVVRTGGAKDADTGLRDGTRLFDAVGRALANVPRKRIAATILITDGQVHDVPGAAESPPFSGPLHAVLTGKRDERDRMLVIEHVPNYALVGKKAELRVRVIDQGGAGATARIAVNRDGKHDRFIDAPIGREIKVSLDVDHAGPNIVQLSVADGPGELTRVNNRAVVQINGVRERLRVLLVSGEPHPGERVWRNLLKADPSVDLVHFTILRPPEKQDGTPVRELSLIAFPIRELFEIKLDDFDLIIFDRYRRRGVLPAIYLDNIVRYIERGGAVLEAAGPAFATALSLFRTPLGAALPGAPTGKVFEQGLRPRLTKAGNRHPVTADLVGADMERPRWGRWFRQIDVTARRGHALMRGVNNRPLLIVDRVGKGRVAQVLSDHIWLWSRGFEGGGPHSEMLRRLAHWLMKEPDLEENDLRAYMEDGKLAVVRRSIEDDDTPVEVTTPSGEVRTVTLKPGAGGRAKATLAIDEVGVYKLSDGRHSALAAVGNLNPREFADMRASADPLKPAIEASGGGVHWLQDGLPSLRRVRAGRAAAGRDWLGIVANRDYRVTSVREVPLLPGLAMLLLGLGALMLAWRREGR
jgi:hypothetical protein